MVGAGDQRNLHGRCRFVFAAGPAVVLTIGKIFWFAAFVSLAAYTNKGISNGEKEEKDDKIKEKGGCALFPAGTGETEKACNMNRSGIGLGVFMW